MFEPGTQVGRYEIQRKLGRGGMGSVYVAHDPVLGRMVAIKVFAGDLDLPDARERFSREARAAAALSHPNIVTVYDFGEYDSQPFIVMEYVSGETLASLIRRKVSVTLADKLRWMEELCAGAGYAHQMQMVHRDVKPANLMIDRAGRLKILDFGIARILGLSSNTSMMIGTPGYMAPEQITGDHPVDHRADQFSIGVVFYELLAYTEAFPGDTLPMITNRILHEEPVPLSRLAPEVPPEIVAIVQKALKKAADDRFPDSETLRMAVARVRRDASNQAWNLNTLVTGRDTPSAPTGARGTGSERRRQDDAIGVAQLTPPPDPRRTDRENLARRRTQQVEAALSEARALLAQGRLELALDACQHALTYDENHVGALRLEEEIETTLRLRSVGDAPPAPADPVPGAPGATRAETLWPDIKGASEAVTRMENLAPAGIPPAPSGAMDRTVLRLPTAPPDATVIAPPRRTPPPVPPPVVPPVPVAQPPLPGAPAAKQGPEAKSTPASKVERGKSVPVQKKSQPIGPALKQIVARSKAITLRSTAIVGASNQVVARLLRNPRTLGIVGATVGVLIVAAVVAVKLLSGPAPTGMVIIEVVPWGTITAIETESGQTLPLPADATTPLSIPLEVGTYQVVVAGPSAELPAQRITVTVEKDATKVIPVRFRVVTPDEYFEQYVAAPAAETPGGEVAPDQSTPTPAAGVPAVPAPSSPVPTPQTASKP